MTNISKTAHGRAGSCWKNVLFVVLEQKESKKRICKQLTITFVRNKIVHNGRKEIRFY